MKIKRSEAHGLSGGGDARLLPTSIAPRLAGASRLGVLLPVDPAFPSRFQRILPSCSSVRLLTQSTHSRALAISYQPCTPRGAGNVKTSTRSPSAPRGFTARGQLRPRRRLPPPWCPFLNEKTDPLPCRLPLPAGRGSRTCPQTWHPARFPARSGHSVKSGQLAESLMDGSTALTERMNR